MGFSPAPIVMGLVLGTLMENSLAQSMILFDHNPFLFFRRPISILFFLFALGGIVLPAINKYRRQAAAVEGAQ